MTIKILRPYQEDAIEELILKTELLLKRDNRTIVFQSPTGSGKTFMTSQYIEQLIEKLPDEDICFLWVSIGKGSLHIQSQESLKKEFQGFPECNLLEEEFFGSRKIIDQNEVVVVNWEKLRTYLDKMIKKLHELSEWRKIGITLAVGTLFGMSVILYIIPFLVKLLY